MPYLIRVFENTLRKLPAIGKYSQEFRNTIQNLGPLSTFLSGFYYQKTLGTSLPAKGGL